MFEHILVPLDGSSLAECVLPHVVALASAFNSDVTLLRVSDQTEDAAESIFPDPVRWRFGEVEARAYLDEWTGRLQAAGVRTTGVLLEGRPADRIIEFATDQQVNLIMVSSHGRSGLSEWKISGVVEKIILRAHMSVMVVPAYQPPARELTGVHYRRVLAPLDCSQRAESVLPFVTTLARVHKSELLLAHVVTRPEVPHREPLPADVVEMIDRLTEYNRTEANRYLKELGSRLPSDVQMRLLISGDVQESLHELISEEGVDLVVLGAHGWGSGTRWPYGSTALNFIVYGTTPLLIMQDLSLNEMQRAYVAITAQAYAGR